MSLIFLFGVIGWVGQVCCRLVGFSTKCCCPEFWFFARARSWSLERAVVFGYSLEPGVGSSSERVRLIWTCSCAVLARARFSSLERVSAFFARAIVPSLERVSGYRPEGLSSSRDRVVFRSSEHLGCWLEQGFLGSSVASLCLVTRATKSSRERACQV